LKKLKSATSFILSFFILFSGVFLVNPEKQKALANRDNPIPLVIHMSDYDFYPACVCISSLCEHANPDTFYKLYILTAPEFAKPSQDKFKLLENKYKNISMEFINMGNKCEEWIMPTERWGKEAYYRLLIPDLIKEDKCIYFDTDTLVMDDLTELYNENLNNNIIGGVPDCAQVLGNPLKFAFGCWDFKKYVQSGVILWDLKKCREINISEQFKEYFRQANLVGGVLDQAAINAVPFGRIANLKLKYNCILYFGYYKAKDDYDTWRFKEIFSREELQEAVNKPVIIHFSCIDKPYKDCVSKSAEAGNVPLIKEWWQHAKRNIFWIEIKENILNKLPAKEKMVIWSALTS